MVSSVCNSERGYRVYRYTVPGTLNYIIQVWFRFLLIYTVNFTGQVYKTKKTVLIEASTIGPHKLSISIKKVSSDQRGSRIPSVWPAYSKFKFNYHNKDKRSDFEQQILPKKKCWPATQCTVCVKPALRISKFCS